MVFIMHVEIICKKENSAERVFFCSWMELCGYMVINREHAVDLPVYMQNITIDQMVITGLRVGCGYNRIVLEITESLLVENSESVLWKMLIRLMSFIHREENDERILYFGYHDDRMEVIDNVARLFVKNYVYMHIFILNRTYGTSDTLRFSFKAIKECIDIIRRENGEQNCFLEFVAIFLHTRLRKAQKFLGFISWEENTSLIEKSDVLLGQMKMLHYQDTLYLIKSYIYENMPGKHVKVWENLRLIQSGHYYVSYQLGFLKEKYWKQKEVALDFYRRARIEMPEYYRADYKIASFYQEQNCYELSEYMYMQVIAKIWGFCKEDMRNGQMKDFDINLFKVARAKCFTIADIEYLIITWRRLLEVLKKHYKNEEKDDFLKNQLSHKYEHYLNIAKLNYNYMEEGIRNSEFLNKMYRGRGERYKDMFEIILTMLLKGREELEKL